ncbi:MAG: TerB family tellurite resistance protein [Ignavibacteriaceae bacterium]|jgi:uncharacterized tellurite resistance protein B-like protein|nr:TerB family tellurite resistance protein [Ignavibacteriaceae bacterium]
MFEYLKKIFSEEQSINSEVQKTSGKKNYKAEIAACALFIEMAKADGKFSDEERNFIISEMKRTFNLDDDCIKDLMALAEQKVKESVSLYEFTTIINNTFTQQEKVELIESLWRLIYTDKKLSAYEDHLIKTISATMNLEHKQLINSKLWVKQQLGLN